MNKFTYTLPSGKKFTMTAPDGTTQAQADIIFYSQAAAGTLVGFAPGQSIGSDQARAIKFALSRLDRGTAGVDDRVVLSITNSIPTISGIPNLIDVPLENPITQADISNIGADNTFTAPAIGPLSSSQVQGLLAQIANYIDQPADVITEDNGVGLYGLDCQQLEQSGYVKPGTYAQFVFSLSSLIAVLSAPGIWTGKNGVTILDNFLRSPGLQNDAMTILLQKSYASLEANGTIVPPARQPVSAVVGQVYTQSGLQTISQLSAATGISLSVPRNVASAATGSPIANLLSSQLTNTGSLASGAINRLTGGALSNISSITSNLKNTVTGGVAALVSNGSVFGTSAVTQWANSGSISQLISSSGIAGGQNFGGITNALGGNITGLTTSLTNNIQGLNVLGKASQFAAGFSNPLSSLSNLGNLNLSSLTSGLPGVGNLTGGLPANLGGLLTPGGGFGGGALGGIAGLPGIPNIGSLVNLGNFSSLTSLSSLGSLGSIGGLFGGGGDALVSATKVAAGYSNTVSRAVVNTAFAKIVGSSKVPLPSFEYINPGRVLNAGSDVSFAQNALRRLGTGTTVFNPNEIITI
jgi:hypothetical protein